MVETGTTNENVLTPSVAALFARGCIKLNPRAAEFVPSAVTSKLESKSNVSTKESLTPSVAAFFARGSIKLNPLAAAFVPRVVVSPEETNNVEKVSIHVECGPHTPGSSPVECEKATGNVVENRASKLVKYGQYHLDPRLSVPPYLAAPLISYVNLGLPSPAPFYLMGADDRPVLAAMALPWFSKDPKTGEDVLMMPPGPEVVCGPPVHSESGFAPVYRAPSSVTITFTFGLPNLGRGNAFFLPADRHLCTARPIPNGVKAWQKAV